LALLLKRLCQQAGEDINARQFQNLLNLQSYVDKVASIFPLCGHTEIEEEEEEEESD
jgi:hypothetical protein